MSYVSPLAIIISNCTYRKLYAEEKEKTKDSKSRQKRDKHLLAAKPDPLHPEPPSDKLLSWQRAVGMVSSASQLAVCMSELEMCVAWEKSNTIVVSVCAGMHAYQSSYRVLSR